MYDFIFWSNELPHVPPGEAANASERFPIK
jgi:hypothetical protein